MTSAPGPRPQPLPLAVLDFGKTNTKLFVFGPGLDILEQQRCAPLWREHRLGDAPCRVLDHEPLWQWVEQSLAQAAARWPLGGVMVSTHGCTAALVGGGRLQHPVLDYESEPPAAVNEAYARIAPGYAETLSPHLAGGLNLGRQLFWIESAQPQAMAATEAILCYPQYWNWRLGAPPVSEVSSLGCHSHLWAAHEGDFSSMVDARGWRPRFPAFARAGAVLAHRRVDPAGGGPPLTLAVHNGVHDSNASLSFYRSLGHTDCTVVSTGTWVIVFNAACPLGALDAGRDMLANITIDGEPVATARFMGGREYDRLSDGARGSVDLAALEAAIGRGQYALPNHAPGGPFPGRPGHLVGPPPQTEGERAAIATLYLACTTDAVLRLMRSRNPVIVDGGLAYNRAFLGLLAALRAPQPVLCNPIAEGSAAGAAAIAYEALGHRPVLQACAPVAPWPVSGLADYHARWLGAAAAHSGHALPA